MRIMSLVVVSSLALAAAPAFAQNKGAGTAPSANPQSNASVTQETQRAIRQSLESSGFKDIRIVPESYVVHAQAPDGSRIVMMVSPDEVQGVVINNGTSNAPPAQGGGANGGSTAPKL
jgi:hypothetical protein